MSLQSPGDVVPMGPVRIPVSIVVVVNPGAVVVVVSGAVVVVVYLGAVTGGPVTLAVGVSDTKSHELQETLQLTNIQSGLMVHSLMLAQNSHSSKSSLQVTGSPPPVVMMMTVEGGAVAGDWVVVVLVVVVVAGAVVVVVDSGAVTGGPVTLAVGVSDAKSHELQETLQFTNIQSGLMLHSLLPAQNSHSSKSSLQVTGPVVMTMVVAGGAVAGGWVVFVTFCSGIGVADWSISVA